MPPPQAGEKDLAETKEPYDLPFPDDRWPQGRPAYAIVVDQLRGWFPGRPSLEERSGEEENLWRRPPQRGRFNSTLPHLKRFALTAEGNCA